MMAYLNLMRSWAVNYWALRQQSSECDIMTVSVKIRVVFSHHRYHEVLFHKLQKTGLTFKTGNVGTRVHTCSRKGWPGLMWREMGGPGLSLTGCGTGSKPCSSMHRFTIAPKLAGSADCCCPCKHAFS